METKNRVIKTSNPNGLLVACHFFFFFYVSWLLGVNIVGFKIFFLSFFFFPYFLFIFSPLSL